MALPKKSKIVVDKIIFTIYCTYSDVIESIFIVNFWIATWYTSWDGIIIGNFARHKIDGSGNMRRNMLKLYDVIKFNLFG